MKSGLNIGLNQKRIISGVLVAFEYYLKGAADGTGRADSFTLGTPAALRCFNIYYDILYQYQ